MKLLGNYFTFVINISVAPCVEVAAKSPNKTLTGLAPKINDNITVPPKTRIVMATAKGHKRMLKDSQTARQMH